MSFITKRERVFNEYELFELPARNEGKLKAYASCTDARAWSHFCSDKTEHLVEIIKRNNETCRPKYVPTDVIVDTIMVAKNAEIARLRRKIEEFEQMLAAYDQLELSCEQKCEIAKAHAAIKAANKELDELCLDLDLSGFTEGIDSEGFETGKSRGDEARQYNYNETPRATPKSYETHYDMVPVSPKVESKAVQMDLTCVCDATTNAKDKRIDEMQDVIITKDAKLNAMKNTIAVMENDVCEPYCVYAHIYTALEKIFGVLCQNVKYKQYLNLLTAGRDTRCIDIKGKILYKLMVLEKFSIALIAPCTQDSHSSSVPDCACFHVEILPRVEATYALTSSESKPKPSMDKKRAHLVADIIENEEMKEILSRDNSSIKQDEDQIDYGSDADTYCIDTENLKRLKNLQENYDDLMTCYEALKNEKDCLQMRCHKYEELEKEFECLKSQLREYNSLWNEKEHYRKRSADLDTLKEQYLILTDETMSLETQLKAEAEINNIKSKSIDELRNENVLLEQKINDATITHEKEKSVLLCKLKAAECKIMCQGQQIKSLSIQIDKLLEQDHEKDRDGESQSIVLLDEVESLKDQIRNLKDAMVCNDEEKQQLQKEFQDKLDIINQLRMEIEDWKSTYEKTLHRNDYLEKYTESIREEIHGLMQENRVLAQDIEEKTTAFENLINVIHNKSQEVSKLTGEVEKKAIENKGLLNKIQDLRNDYKNSISSLENKRKQALESLQLARQESEDLLVRVKSYDDLIQKEQDVSKSLESQVENLKIDLVSHEDNNSILLQEIQRLREINNLAVSNISNINNEKNQYKHALELSEKESGLLKDKLCNFESLTQQLRSLQLSHESIVDDKNKLEHQLIEKETDLNSARYSIDLSQKESNELIDKLKQSENLKSNMTKLKQAYQDVLGEKLALQKDIFDKNKELETLLQTMHTLKLRNEQLLQKCKNTKDLEEQLRDLMRAYDELLQEKTMLQNNFDNRTEEINSLNNKLENTIEENRNLLQHIKNLETNQLSTHNSIKLMQSEKSTIQATLEIMKRESEESIDKMKYFKNVESEFNKLKIIHEQLESENDKMQKELHIQKDNLQKMQEQNLDLHSHSQHLISHSKDLENALITTRTELIQKSSFTQESSEEVLKEIAVMKREKILNQQKIRDLRDQLEESENKMSDLIEDVLARDDRIAVLENHINALQDEVRRLQIDLSGAVDAGEQIKDISYQKIDNSLKSMEAHHSKATHNMKMEIAKLQHTNTRLENQLSCTTIKSDEYSLENNRYKSQMIKLQNEREIIVTDIKQLELSSVGDSALSPDSCNIEEVLASIDRIRKCLDSRHLKSLSLEQTLLKVQTSSELLLNKAEEAKKLVEKEKLKTVNEKEEAIKDKQKMENQLRDLKDKLQKQATTDKAIIKDLEAEILNQKLIIEKINKSTQDFINKLKEELQSLRNLYQDSIAKVSELEQKIQDMSEEKNIFSEVLKKTKADLEEKSKEIEMLRMNIHDLKKKPDTIDLGTQAKSFHVIDMETQTDNDSEVKIQTHLKNYDIEIGTKKSSEDYTNLDLLHVKKINHDKNVIESEQQQKPKAINEVQILRAKVEPTFDFVRNTYLKYKIQQLSPGRLEQYSVPYITDESNEDLSPILIDIYNKKNVPTDTSKELDEIKSPNRMSTGRRQQSVNKIESEIIYSKQNDSRTFSGSASSNSKDKNLFVIYKDSDSTQSKNDYNESSRSAKGNSDKILGVMKKDPNEKNIALDQKYHKDNVSLYLEDLDVNDDDSVKQKIKINLPRVDLASSSLVSLSENEKKSLDSYSTELYSMPKRFSTSELINHTTTDVLTKKLKDDSAPYLALSNQDNHNIYSLNAYSPIISAKVEIITPKQQSHYDESHHKLFRVNADSLLLKNVNKTTEPSPENLGLEYIMDTVQREDDLNYPKHVSVAKAYETNSDDKLGENGQKKFIHSQPRLSTSKINLTKEYKTITRASKINEMLTGNKQKSFVNRGTMANLSNSTEDYEDKITQLTKAMENMEIDYKKKIEAIKVQYDRNIKSIINEHNEGVKSLQGLHEETLQDIFKVHENEVENLRSMSIEAMRKADKLEKESRTLKAKTRGGSSILLDEEPIKIPPVDLKKRKGSRGEKTLTKTTVEAFNVKPKSRANGPCTCSLDINLSDTIRDIFEEVGVEQRKMAEHTYMKYIANKIINGNIEVLDAQELSFLHLKVCRMWKCKLNKEEVLQKKIDTLESELMNKQRHTQQHIAELDRKVAEERQRLQEVREAVCRSKPLESQVRADEPHLEPGFIGCTGGFPANGVEKDNSCDPEMYLKVGERRSAGDVALEMANTGLRPKRPRNDTSRAVLAKLDVEERREKKMYTDEPPTRLRKSHERQTTRPARK